MKRAAKFFLACLCASLFGNAFCGRPSVYLDKITCTGAQYVNTGLMPDKNLRAAVTLSTTDTSHDKMVFGKRQEGFYFLCWFGKAAGTSVSPCIGSSGNISGRNTNKSAGAKWTLDFSAAGIYADETEIFPASSLSTYIKDTTSTKPLMLFGLSNNGSIDSRKYYGDCYRARFYDGAKLVRDLLPCQDAEGVACLYNLAYDSSDPATGGEYYYSATTTAFDSGARKAVLDPQVSYGYSGNALSFSFRCGLVSDSCSQVKAVVQDSQDAVSESILATGVQGNTDYSCSVPVDLAKGPFKVSLSYEDASGTVIETQQLEDFRCFDPVGVTCKSGSVEEFGEDGEFVIAFPDGVSNDRDLVVSYTMSGTAVNGGDYVRLDGKATIPAGEQSVVVRVHQAPTCAQTAVKDVTLTLVLGNYVLAAGSTATISKKFYKHDNEKNVLLFKSNANTITSGRKVVNTAGSFTLAGWVKLDKPSISSKAYFMGQQGDALSVFMLYYDKTADQVVFVRRAGAWSYSDGDYTRVAAPGSGEWHFYTAVWDADSLQRRVYVDGVLQGAGSGKGATAPSQNFTVGYSGYAGYMRGGMGEMSVWGKALSEIEIRAIMSRRPVDDELADCLAYWPMVEGDGGALMTDLAGDNDLTIASPSASVLGSTSDFPPFATCSAKFAVAQTIGYVPGENAFRLSATVTEPGEGTVLKVILTDKDGKEVVSRDFATDVVGGVAYETTLAGLDDDTTYLVTVYATDAAGFKTKTISSVYAGAVSVSASGKAVGYGDAGVLTVSRAGTAAATAYDLVVTYAVGGTAVSGTDYLPLTGTVTIPAGSASAEVYVRQSPSCTETAEKSVVLDLTGGGYKIDAHASQATQVKKFYSCNYERNVLDVVSSSTLTTGKKVVSTSGSFSLSGWVKLDKPSISGKAYIIGQQADAQPVYMLYYDKATDQVIFARRAWNWTYSESQLTRAAAPADCGWHYYTAVWDAVGLKRQLYIDGVLAGQGDGTGANAPTTNLTIGNNGYAGSFFGGMAELSVWGKALSAAEILSLMWNRPTDFTDCLAYWPFDEGVAATTARDISGNGTTVTIPDAKKAVLEKTADFVDFKAGDTRIKYDVVVKCPTNRVSVAVSGTEMVGNQFVAGSEGTFAVTGEGTFLGWDGDVPDELRMNKSITMTIDATKIISPVFAYDWVYDATAKTISDGYWTLDVTSGAEGLTITRVNAATYANLQGKPMMRLLDLRKPVADTNDAPYSVVQINAGVFVDNPILTEVRLPDSLKCTKGTWGNGDQRGPFGYCANLETVTPLVPAGLVELGISTFDSCTKLTGELVFGAAQGAFFTDGPYHGLQFQKTKITSVTLHKSIDVLPINVFNGCTSITTFSLRHRPTTIKSGAFGGWTAKQCRFMIDPNDANWAAYMAESANFTPWAELADADRKAYKAAFPNEKRPLGLSLTLPAKQWLCNAKRSGLSVVVR